MPRRARRRRRPARLGQARGVGGRRGLGRGPDPAPPARGAGPGADRRRRALGHCCILGSCVGSAYMGGQPSVDGLGAQLVVPGLVAVDLAQPVRGAVLGQPRRGTGGPDVDRVARHVGGRARAWPPSGRPPPPSRTSRSPRGGAVPGTPASASRCRRRTRRRRPRRRSRPGAGRRAAPGRGWPRPEPRRRRPSCRRGRHRRPRRAQHGARCERECATRTGATVADEDAGDWWPRPRRSPRRRRAGRRRGPAIRTRSSFVLVAVGHAASQGSAVLPARMRFSIRRRYAPARSIGACAC